MNAEDTPRIADAIRLAGDLLDAHGQLVWKLTEEWEKGLRSPNLEPSASDRYELANAGNADEFMARIPTNDRTGEQAIDSTDDIETHAKLRDCLKRMYRDAAEVVKIVEAVVPPVPFDANPLEWCANHLRVQLCEPTHRGNACRFCYDFKLLHKVLPPPSLLGIRHRYGRVTAEQVDKALAEEKRRGDTVAKVNRAVREGRRKAS